MEWADNLENVSEWQPDSGRAETLRTGLLLTCQAAQSRIISEANIERRFNINNFDSGSGLRILCGKNSQNFSLAGTR